MVKKIEFNCKNYEKKFTPLYNIDDFNLDS